MVRARSWSWLWILIVGVVLFEAVRHTIIATGNPNLLPSLILLGAAVVPVSFVGFVLERRLAYDVGAGAVTVIAVVTAGFFEYNTLRTLGTLPITGVALIEETAKLIAPLGVVLFTRHRRPADGLLLGAAAGAGFAVLETMGYGFVVLIKSQGDLSAVDNVLLLRGLLSPAAHIAWPGLAAAALWDASDRHWHPRALLRLVLIFAVAVALHATWDSIDSTVGYVVLAALSLALPILTAHRLHRAAVASSDSPATWEPKCGARPNTLRADGSSITTLG